MRYQPSRGAPLTKGAPLLFSRTGSWFSVLNKNATSTLTSLLFFRKPGANDFLVCVDGRRNRWSLRLINRSFRYAPCSLFRCSTLLAAVPAAVGAGKLLTFSNKRDERLVVAWRVEQLHSRFSIWIPTSIDALSEIARSCRRDKPAFKQFRYDASA